MQTQGSKTDTAEDLQIFLVSLKQAVKMVKNGQVQDMDSALAILAAKEYLQGRYLILLKQFLVSLKHRLHFSGLDKNKEVGK